MSGAERDRDASNDERGPRTHPTIAVLIMRRLSMQFTFSGGEKHWRLKPNPVRRLKPRCPNTAFGSRGFAMTIAIRC